MTSAPSNQLKTQDLARALETLRTRVGELTDRVEDLESDNERLESESAQLESQNQRLEAENESLSERVQELEHKTTQLEDDTTTLEDETDHLEQATTRLENRTTAAINRSGTNKDRIAELQARELEKGAHLLEMTVSPRELEIEADHLEKIRKDDDRSYYRLPDSEDPLERGGSVSLAHADLLPIQQLARMDEPMLRSTTSTLPSRLAAELWKARVDPAVGDDPWKSGCKGVRSYVKASDLKHWIRRQEAGVSDSYAKKLVSRTIDALLELSKNRLAVRKKRQRKNGLEYTERRVLLTADAEIPGERSGGTRDQARDGTRGATEDTAASSTDAPETAAVTGSQ
ncbi:hypothetical protein [Halostagnicola sp. A-GB9-2]|uniref:hypothetical protein n=1 Tax=Halostagnicola sp. A-GB9-2 TaxID=3048066 RepID=UPI0024BFDF70|nr:hypothetical protein [Halostagnicola sp. A-GB9-2]MDJ1432429.1 hypothetical protein [Halostagnicola sp. A-GB9-2]